MPRSAEVLITVQGADVVDTYARQLAAFEVLAQIISMNEMVEYHMELLPIEKELLADYRSTSGQLLSAFKLSNPSKPGRSELQKRIGEYRSSSTFRAYIKQQLLGPAARVALDRKAERNMQAARDERLAADRERSRQRELDKARSEAKRERAWNTLFGPGGGMLGLGAFLLLAGVGLMRSTNESGMAAVGFVCLLLGVGLVAAGLSEFWVLIG